MSFKSRIHVTQLKSQKGKAPVKTIKYFSYIDMLKRRREEAQRTILVEIEGVKDSGGLKAFCQRFGRLEKYYLYRASGKVLQR